MLLTLDHTLDKKDMLLTLDPHPWQEGYLIDTWPHPFKNIWLSPNITQGKKAFWLSPNHTHCKKDFCLTPDHTHDKMDGSLIDTWPYQRQEGFFIDMWPDRLSSSNLPEFGILLKTIWAYWSKRRVCNIQFFSQLITTQLKISHGVTANSLYLSSSPCKATSFTDHTHDKKDLWWTLDHTHEN